ncbi:hypothetical protein H4R20_000690 [Coemansia guatemalensis]|uniref:CCHC-type domain-containing protein n=1 Tax=Coemansia guatemalensis TaxID=2761395 RepID=A0A9W8I0Z0_9FUNG|nr:hypothetical protein H4R20_000690 [Coemansia guatemalensis]
MAQPHIAKVLVVGSVNGHLADFFAKVKKLDARYGPFSILLVVGNLFANSDDHAEEVISLLKNEITVSVMTYAVVGDRPLPRRVRERASLKSGEICNNLVILSGQGVLQTSEGVKIAYLGGRYISQCLAETSNSSIENSANAAEPTDRVAVDPENSVSVDKGNSTAGNNEEKGTAGSEISKEEKGSAASESINEGKDDTISDSPPDDDESTHAHFDKLAVADLISQVAAENEKTFQKAIAQPSIDILLTFDWPYGAAATSPHTASDLSPPSTQFASNKISHLCAAIMPRYHFAAGEESFYERQPWKYSDRISIGRGSSAVPHFTRFIGLGAVNASRNEKQRWFYAMNVNPLRNISQGTSAPNELPANCTTNPLFRFGKIARVLDTKSLPRVLSAIDSSGGGNEASLSNRGGQGKRPPPPLNYICHGCNQPGHWISDCPVKGQNKRQRSDSSPPSGYVCHKCKKQGHWRSDCPADSSTSSGHASDALSKCWFCLANPDVDQNLMAAIGEEAYVAMAKGALVAGGSAKDGFHGHFSPIPGGGHVLIVPIVHTDSLRRACEGSDNAGADQRLSAEIDRWTEAVSALFAEYDCAPLIFETSRCLPHVHTTLQMIPIPNAKAESVKPALEDLCKADGLALAADYPPAQHDGYFALRDPASGNDLFLHMPKGSKSFNLELGRKLAARILGVPAREHWRQCVVSEDKEAAERDRFIAAFSKHDFTR